MRIEPAQLSMFIAEFASVTQETGKHSGKQVERIISEVWMFKSFFLIFSRVRKNS